MYDRRTLNTREISLMICFAALYAIFGLWPISPIIGLPGFAITMASITAPVIGVVLGSYLGMLSTLLGGTIVFFLGHFSPPSFLSGIVTSALAGSQFEGKHGIYIFTYFSFLFFFAFYPFVGPAWLYPPMLWFQLIGFLILASPLQSFVLRNMWKPKTSFRLLLLAFFTISLTSTLAGQIAGSLVFEFQVWPAFIADANVWRLNWQLIAWIYPLERVIIAAFAAIISALLFLVLKSARLLPWLNPQSDQDRS
jgi:hypothetical protein